MSSEQNQEEKGFPHWGIALIIGFVALISGGSFFLWSFEKKFENKVYPGIFVGEFSVENMTQPELEKFLRDMEQKLSTQGIGFTLKNEQQQKQFSLVPVAANEISSQEFFHFDEKKEAERLVNFGKQGNVLTRTFRAIQFSLSPRSISLKEVIIDQNQIQVLFDEKTKEETIEPKDADIVVQSYEPLRLDVVPSQVGLLYDFTSAQSQMSQAWSRLSVPQVSLVAQKNIPRITDEEAAGLAQSADVSALVAQLPIRFSVQLDQEGPVEYWEVDKNRFQSWIGAHEFAQEYVGLGVKTALVEKYVNSIIAPSVETEAEDARFRISADGKVEEFQDAKNGTSIDRDVLVAQLNDFVRGAVDGSANVTSTFVLSLKITEPEIKTSDVNDLGITDILGVGISNFKGSPANRVHNIQAALKKLNGILIKPGEEFSAIKFTQPYTIEAGYLPEKVIKGDSIVPEIGGGLCQIGTTLFRMAMNSGLEITERRNHSLVVSYYNDPSNNLPGTDATIYDPAPDFKFKNDTPYHVLIQASANVSTGDLKFVLWGTKDGRKGSYTKPVVSRWISPGEPRIIETDKLEPGKRECQNAFRGANASFTYTRVLGDGTEQNTLFESYYRPLPQICLVGKDPNAVVPPPSGEQIPVAPASEQPVSSAIN